jgi:hypothetical protein
MQLDLKIKDLQTKATAQTKDFNSSKESLEAQLSQTQLNQDQLSKDAADLRKMVVG